MKPIISFDDFSKIDLRVGRVLHAEEKEGSDKLLRLKVDFGEEGTRNILTGIKQWYKPAQLIDKDFIFIINLEPRMIMGEESQGMILAAEGPASTRSPRGEATSLDEAGKKPLPLKPSGKTLPGATIR